MTFLHFYSDAEIDVDVTRYDISTVNSPNEDFECIMHDSVSENLYLVQKNHYAELANIYKFYPEEGGMADEPALESLGKYNLHTRF